VECARARLTNNLSTLCSVDTYTAFKEARSALPRIVKNVKARAAANPAAALAIGAGLTWRVIQRPPITPLATESAERPLDRLTDEELTRIIRDTEQPLTSESDKRATCENRSTSNEG
jgi:hypothetical protein